MEGWFKIHRKIIKWEWHDEPNVLSLFIHLLVMANHEDNQWHGTTIKRGQLVTSLVKLADITGESVQEIRTGLKKLESTNEITNTSTNKYRIITICNYDKYQDADDREQQTNQQTKQQSSNNQSTTNKNEKNEKNIIVVDDNIARSAREALLNLGELWREAVLREIYRNTQRIATDEQLKAYIEAYAENLVLQGVGAGEDINHQQRFINWLRIRLQVEQRQKQQQAAQMQRRPDEPWKRDDRGKVYEKF